MSSFKFTGAPCLQHCNYVFYKSFRYKVGDENRVLSLGDFFFLKILQDIPVCIGEIELLWEDKTSNQLLSSLRLYFQPEHTQDGRNEDTGEDEMLVLGERLVVRLDDLLPLMMQDLKWPYGHSACGSAASCKAQVKEENGLEPTEGKQTEAGDSDEELNLHSGAANVAIMSYPRYCRYRAVMRRLEGCENEWLHLAIVMAIGGFSGRAPGCRVMFCRETFYHSDIDDLDIRMDHMLPMLKNRPKTSKKIKPLGRKDSQHDSDSMEELFANITPSISSSSRPRRSTEPSELNDDKVSAEEQAFLIGLHKFMHDAKMPIGRIPYLGFKQIDLYMFYKHAERLGGYDSITTKRMWKQLYDKMGGNISNTSAATCTRKHYERLLLPYERHLRKIKAVKAKKKGLAVSTGIMEKLAIKKEEKMGAIQKETTLTPTRKSEKKEVLIKEEKEQVEEVIANVPQKAEVKKEPEKPSGDAELQHSIGDWKNGAAEPLEIPNVRHRQSSSSKDQNSNNAERNDPEIQLQQQQQQQQQPLPSPYSALGLTEQQLSAMGFPGAVLPADFGAAEGTVIPNTNLVYRGGYLVPIPQAQMLQNPWGLVAQPQSSLKPAKQPSVPAEDPKDVAPPNPASLPSPAHSRRTNHSLAAAAISSMDAVMLQNAPGLMPGAQIPVAHANTYQPPPYLLTDHIQQPAQTSSSTASLSSSAAHHHRRPNQHHSHQSNSNTVHSSNSSQHIISLLHPKPANLKCQRILPPAPIYLFLDPSNSNVSSPLPPASNSGSPPTAHSQSRKRLYPFENPAVGATFPSPDMVLDRIKSSTVLPNNLPSRPHAQRQQYDSPRDIFKQTAQTAAAPNQSSSSMQAKKSAHQPDMVPSKRPASKSKTPVRKNSHVPPLSPYSVAPGLELQASANGASAFGKSVDQMKLASSSGSNGLMSQDQQGLGKGIAPHLIASAENPLLSGKDGRLTSALFGAQFTAMPRPTKQTESASVPINSSAEAPSSSASAAAAAAMTINPLLHPAFMNTFLPPSVPSSALNPQLQMFAAGAYATNPAQLAAYEELLRQNGYSSYLSAAGTLPAKVGKKN